MKKILHPFLTAHEVFDVLKGNSHTVAARRSRAGEWGPNEAPPWWGEGHRVLVKAYVFFAALTLSFVLGACTYEAQQCCDCMASKTTPFGGDCMTETMDQCVSALAQNPPNTDVIASWCRTENDGYCTESCANILYKN